MRPKKYIVIFISGFLAMLSMCAFWVSEIVTAIVTAFVPGPISDRGKKLFAVTLPTKIQSFKDWMYAMYARWHITHGVTCA